MKNYKINLTKNIRQNKFINKNSHQKKKKKIILNHNKK